MNLHHTVLRAEAVGALNIKGQGAYIDATLGSGGHSCEIISRLGAQNSFLGLDVDQTALDAFIKKGIPKSKAKIFLECANFKDLASVVQKHRLTNIQGILADLGWRMDQFAAGRKGFSFQVNEPLYMTYGHPADYAFTAHDVVNDWTEEDIANVIFAYGEERKARKIAKAIVEARIEKPITSSGQLAEIISKVVRKNPKVRIHPATKTFQALRIVVNDELSVIETFIDSAFSILEPQGRLAIITFHSLEDRVVKHRFRSLKNDQQALLVTKKPITASAEELAVNPRARSAKLRILEKI